METKSDPQVVSSEKARELIESTHGLKELYEALKAQGISLGGGRCGCNNYKFIFGWTEHDRHLEMRNFIVLVTGDGKFELYKQLLPVGTISYPLNQ